MVKRELEIAVVSVKDLPGQTVASSDAKVYGIICLLNGFEFLQWKTSEAEDVMNPKWNQVIQTAVDEGAIHHDSAHLLISICVKKESAMQDEEVGCLSLPLRSFVSHVGTLVVRDYPLKTRQGPLSLELGVKLSDKFIPDVSMAATRQGPLMSPYNFHSPPPANYAVTPPAPLMSPYNFHSPPPANYAVTPPAPLMSPYYFHSPRPANSVVTPPGTSMSSYHFHSPPPANSVVIPPGTSMSPYHFHSPPPANSVVTPPGTSMSSYHFHSPPPANSVVTPPAPLMSPYYFRPRPPANSVVTPPGTSMSPYYFHSPPPLYPGRPYPPRPSIYRRLSSLQLLLQGGEIISSFSNLVTSIFGDWGD